MFENENADPIFMEQEKLDSILRTINYTDPLEKEATEKSYQKYFEQV